MALTIRLTPEEEAYVEELKKTLNVPSASKALMGAAKLILFEFSPQKEKLLMSKANYSNLEFKYKKLIELLQHKHTLDESINAIIYPDGHPGSQPGPEVNCNHIQLLAADQMAKNDCRFSDFDVIDIIALDPGDKVLLLVEGVPTVCKVDEVDHDSESFSVEEMNGFIQPDLRQAILLM